MRNPNGYGGIVKMKGNRRKPYRVRITAGYETDEYGHTRQIQRTLGWYETYEEAADALTTYHKDPVSLDPNITFAEVYSRWSKEKFEKANKSLKYSYSAAFKAVPMLHDVEFRKLRKNHLQNAVDTCGKNYPTLCNIKVVFNALYVYALQNDLVQKDYSDFVDIEKHKPENKKEPIHTNFKEDEIKVLWDHTDNDVVIKILLMIYTGLRIEEFFSLRKQQINLDERIIVIDDSKTEAGIRRVPIAQKIIPFLTTIYAQAENRLFPSDLSLETQQIHFRKDLRETCRNIGLSEHLPHDTRHTTASMLHKAHVDLYTRKRILGHSTSDVTEKVYTHVSDEELIAAIDLI